MKDMPAKLYETPKPIHNAQDVLVSVKAFIDKDHTLEEYESRQSWLEDMFYQLTEYQWREAAEEVSEILYKWGRFLLDNGKYEEGLLRFWEIYNKFEGTRWYNPVFEELVAREQPEDMVFVEGGLFILGENEKEQKIVPYFLDICPVTNAQYFEFIRATGHSAPYHWHGNMYPIGKANHPITWVSLEDAKAYAKWCGKRLPKEREWEKAARGPKNYNWPWGDLYESKKCNCRDSGIGDTTPIGQFPGGKSAYDCYDMTGNVWEWTDSWYDNNKTHKVLRGGSWYTFEDFTVCTYRNFASPHLKNGLYGFRCAKSFQN